MTMILFTNAIIDEQEDVLDASLLPHWREFIGSVRNNPHWPRFRKFSSLSGHGRKN